MFSSRVMPPVSVKLYTSVKKPISLEKWNALQMKEPTRTPVERFAHNLKKLIEITGMPVSKVADGAKITPKQVYNFMAAGHDFRLKGIEKVANAFGLTAWQMLAYDLEASPPANKQVLQLLELFSKADESGRATILRVAEIAAEKTPK